MTTPLSAYRLTSPKAINFFTSLYKKNFTLVDFLRSIKIHTDRFSFKSRLKFERPPKKIPSVRLTADEKFISIIFCLRIGLICKTHDALASRRGASITCISSPSPRLPKLVFIVVRRINISSCADSFRTALRKPYTLRCCVRLTLAAVHLAFPTELYSLNQPAAVEK